VEDHGDFILGPVSPKEYKDTMAELNGSRTNRVFEFFKFTALERLGFARHREAPESRPGQNTRYPLPVLKLPKPEPELPALEVPDPKFE
jgi:hypothetical protein